MDKATKQNVYMIAGCNGSGKTTAVMTLLPEYLNIFNFINADEIAKGLAPLNPESASLQAGRLMLQQLDKMIFSKKDFAFETTSAGLGHIKTLKKCRLAGYKIHIIYLYLSSETLAIKRVANRVQQGGHNIPERDIIRRYLKGLKNIFKSYIQLADYTEIIDNSYGLMQTVAIKQGSYDWHIQNVTLWQEIEQKVNHD